MEKGKHDLLKNISLNSRKKCSKLTIYIFRLIYSFTFNLYTNVTIYPRVLVRCDLNVPLSKGVITDDTRIRGSIPTIKYLLDRGAKVLLTSHLGRPKGGFEEKFTLAPIAPRLSQLLGKPVPLVSDCIGMAVAKHVQSMKNGDVALLENVRFYPEEEKNDPGK